MLPPTSKMVLWAQAVEAYEIAKSMVGDKIIKPVCTYCDRVTGYVVGSAETNEERRFWTGLLGIAGWNYFMVENQIFLHINPCHVHMGKFDGLDGKPCNDKGYNLQEAQEYRYSWQMGRDQRQLRQEEKRQQSPVAKKKMELEKLGL